MERPLDEVPDIWDPSVKEAWVLEARERLRRLQSGEDPGMTLEEFFAE